MATEQRDVKFTLSAQDRASAAINGLRSNLGSLGGQVGTLNTLLGRTGPILGSVFAPAVIAAFIKGTASGIDKLNDLAEAAGTTATNMSALEDIGARAGVEIDGVGDAVLKLNKYLQEAKPGSEQSGVLKRLGLDAQELRRIDPAEALRRVAAALNTFTDDGDRARAMQLLFGKSTRELAVFIKALGKETELLGTITEEQNRQAVKFNDEMDAMKKNTLDFARTVASYAIPTVNRFADELRAGQQAFGGFWEALGAIGTRIPKGGPIESLNAYRKELAKLQKTREDIESGVDGGRFSAFGTDRLAKIDKEAAELQKLIRYFEILSGSRDTGAGGGRAGDPERAKKSLGDVGGDGKGKAKKGPAALSELPEFLREAQRAIEATDTAKIDALQAKLAGLFQLRAANAGGPGAVAVDEAIARTREELEKLDPAAVAAAESTRTLNALLAGTPAYQLAEAARKMQLLNDELAKATTPERIEQLKQAKEQLQGVVDALQGKKKDVTQDRLAALNAQAGASIEAAMGGTILAAFRRDTDQILNMWGDMLLSMAAQAAAMQLTKYIFGSDFGSSGLVEKGSWLEKAFGFFGGFFAEGGTLGAGKWGIAGERGPELIKGPAQVVPLDQAQASAASRGTTVNNTFNVAAGVQRHEVLSLLNQFGSMMMGQMDQRLRRAGVS